MCRKLLLFSILLFISTFLKSQDIKGKIIDSKTKKPLPFVNIIYGKSNLGTTTNIDGVFNISGTKPIHKLYLSYLGYYSDSLLLCQENSLENIVIKLRPKTFNLEEVVILPGENPANRIINKVIENKDLNNPEKMSSFSCTSYNKMIFTLGKDTTNIPDSVKYKKSKLEQNLENHHLLVLETINEKEFIQPDKYNEKIVASKVSGFSDPIFSLIASQIQSFSFYNEYFEILDKMYVNPISKGSTNRYFFLMEDTLYNEKNDTIFIISYRPRKGKKFDGLKGFLHINTNKYAIQSVVAEALEKNQGMVVGIQQNYEYVDNKQWFPKELITNIVFVDALASSGVDDYDMVAKGKSYVSNINLNPQLSKKNFNRVEIKVLEDANKKTDEFWQNQRTQPLSEIEIETYRVIDSISKAEKLEKKLSGLEALMNGNIPVKCFNLPLNRLMDYNSYEGYRLGLGLMTNDKISRYFSVGGYFGYGFKDKAWKYGGDLILNLHENTESKIHFLYTNDVVEKSGYSFFETPDFTTTEIYRKYMIENMDLIEKYQISFSFLSLQYLKTKIFYNQSYNTATDDYTYGPSIANSTNEFIFNEIGVQFRYAYNEKFLQTLKARYTLGTNYPIFYGNIIKGTNLFDGEFEYTKYEAKVTKTFKTKSLGKTKLAIAGGLIDGKIPVSKMYNGHGSYQSFSIEAENSFGTMRMGEFYSDKFLSIFFKHDFGNLLFSSEKFSPKFAVVNNFGIGELSQNLNHQTTQTIRSIEKGYYECGLLINNILNQSFLGYGFGLFYRYGPYAFTKTADNFSYKLSLTIGL
ncbi:MAG: DUF5686 and carboxypeptidase regulatory-like domain-containing protein [Bacteroidales bacterium]|nr:DUF5686 and carboxypeptidase regulatory-like domain-containing protein [Bacteroidales bacterium]